MCFKKFYVTLYSPFKDDLSYNKNASQSHTYPGTAYGADNAVDGNTATCMRTDAIGGNSPYQTVWWRVDLGGVYNIYSVNILFKNYNGYGMIHRNTKTRYFTQDGVVKGRSWWSVHHLQSQHLVLKQQAHRP